MNHNEHGKPVTDEQIKQAKKDKSKLCTPKERRLFASDLRAYGWKYSDIAKVFRVSYSRARQISMHGDRIYRNIARIEGMKND